LSRFPVLTCQHGGADTGIGYSVFPRVMPVPALLVDLLGVKERGEAGGFLRSRRACRRRRILGSCLM
jgi:hypothetical protein